MIMSPLSLASAGPFHGENMSLLILIVKATLILIGALGVTLAMQRAAAGARHLVWLVTLGALLLIPALTVWAPIHLRILPAAPVTNGTASSAGIAATRHASVPPGDESAAATRPLDVAASQHAVAPETAPTTETPSIADRIRNTDLLTILLVTWLAVVLAIVIAILNDSDLGGGRRSRVDYGEPVPAGCAM